MDKAMTWLFASGHAIDIVLAVIGIELVWLIARARWSPLRALLCLAPGVLILLALRAALTGLDWRWIAVLLLLSFPVNLADLVQRTRDML
jgi:predicted membrane channel-forming protein YqfA (hemolysin III family)